MKKLKAITFCFSAAILFLSCNKDDDEVKENNQSVSDVLFLAGEVMDIISISEDALSDFDSRMRATENDCKTVILKPSSQIITVDFGNNSCIVEDGRSRKGKINIKYQGKYRNAGSKTEITLDNYYANGKRVKGKIEIYTIDNLHYTLNILDFYNPINTEDSTTWNASLNKVWISGMNTSTIWDDQYELTGTSSGQDQLEQIYTANISGPLLINYACFKSGILFPTKGILETATGKFPMRTINFGQGDCDQSIVLTIDGESQVIRY